MTIFADKGMGISIIRQIIENISHYFCLDAAERELTPIMPVASEIRDGEHLMSPSCLSYRLYESRCQREKLLLARGLSGAFVAGGFNLHRRDAQAICLTATWYASEANVAVRIPPKIGSRSEPGVPEVMFHINGLGYGKGNAGLKYRRMGEAGLWTE
jgi:hypothetical protein